MAPALPLLEVERVAPVDVGSGRDAVVVVVPERADVVGGVEPEGVGVLAEAVQEWVFREVRPQAEVLGFKDQGRSRGVEEDLLRVGTDDGEGEGLLGVLELEGARVRGGAPLRSRDDRLGDLVDLVPLVLDLDMQATICLWVSIWSMSKAVGIDLPLS